MSDPNTAFDELTTTTLRARGKSIADNVSNSNALLARIKAKHGVILDGGREIVEPLDYAENGTYQRFSGYDTLNINPSVHLSAAKYDWKNQVVHVSASGDELRKNSGKNALIKFVKARVTNAERSFKNNMSTDIYSDGTATNQINGLQSLIADAGTGTVGGIDSSTYTFWQNKAQLHSAPLQGGGAVTAGADTIKKMMLNLWIRLERGAESPDFIVADYNYFTFYEESLTDLQRYTNDGKTADGSFQSLKYKNADVFHDGDSGISANHMYFVNTDYLKMVTHEAANMKKQDSVRPTNQDAVVIPIINTCNLVCSNRDMQGVLKA